MRIESDDLPLLVAISILYGMAITWAAIEWPWF